VTTIFIGLDVRGTLAETVALAGVTDAVVEPRWEASEGLLSVVLGLIIAF